MNFLYHVWKTKRGGKILLPLFFASFAILFLSISFFSLKTPNAVSAPAISGVSVQNITSESVEISWKTDVVATSKIYYGTDTGVYPFSSFNYCGTDTGAGVYNHCVRISGLLANTTYYVKVESKDTTTLTISTLQGYSFRTSSETSDVTPPTAPVLTTDQTSSVITLHWTAATDDIGVTEYRVYESGAYVPVSPTTLSYHYTDLEQGTNYSFHVDACDASLKCTSSNIVSASLVFVDTASPSVPTNLVATAISSSKINLSWTASTDNVGVAGYRVERCLGTSCTAFLQTGTGTAASYSDTGLTAGTMYRYQVRAVDAAGNLSGYSAIASATTQTTQPAPDTASPSVPTNLVATAISSSKINLSWTASTDNVGVAGYKIYRDGTYILSTSATSASVVGLAPETTYRFIVRANDETGNTSVDSISVSATTLFSEDTTAPGIPSNLIITNVSSSKISLSWNATTDNVGVKGYNIFRNNNFLASVTATSYSDLGGTPSSTYSYQVSAYDAAGNVGVRSSSVSVTTPPLSTDSPVTFSVQIGKEICRNNTAYAPITFSVVPPEAGNFSVAGTAIGNKTFTSGVFEMQSGFYAWEGVAKQGYLSSEEENGSFTVSSKACQTSSVSDVSVPATTTAKKPVSSTVPPIITSTAPSKPPAEPPVIAGETNEQTNESANEPADVPSKTFATYAETDAAMQKDAADIPASASLSQKLALTEEIRNTYAFAPESPTVVIGGASFSRVLEPEKVVEKVENIIQERTPDAFLSDTDTDEISDYDETNIYGTDPKVKDTDGDGLSDSMEILAGTNPLEKNISPVAYEDPKTNTVSAVASTSVFALEKAEAIYSPGIGGEQEKITGVTLEGKALPNSFVTLYIFSTPVVVTVKTDAVGRWTYTVDKELENGKHTMYVAMTESSGKIIAKSAPNPFVKTAEAVTLGSFIPSANANASANRGFFHGNLLWLSLGLIALSVLAGVAVLGILTKRKISDIGNGGDIQKND
jgi:chitodextrinase